ncbi:hypothetical protein L4D17_19690 [Vibrio splendidus]
MLIKKHTKQGMIASKLNYATKRIAKGNVYKACFNLIARSVEGLGC